MAFVEDLNGPWLYESMYADDPEAGKLAALPGMEEILEMYPFQAAYNIFMNKKYNYSELSLSGHHYRAGPSQISYVFL